MIIPIQQFFNKRINIKILTKSKLNKAVNSVEKANIYSAFETQIVVLRIPVASAQECQG
jgi:hypothetical protein